MVIVILNILLILLTIKYLYKTEKIIPYEKRLGVNTKYYIYTVILIIYVILTSSYLIIFENISGIIEGIKTVLIILLIIINKKIIINRLKQNYIDKLEISMEEVRYLMLKDEEEALRKFNSFNIEDEYNLLDTKKTITNEYMELTLYNKDRKHKFYKKIVVPCKKK